MRTETTAGQLRPTHSPNNRPSHSSPRSMLLCVAGASLMWVAGAIEYRLHVNLSTAVSLAFMFVVLSAIRWSFLQATCVAVAAVICLDFFFIPPIFTFSVERSGNWISLATFEVAALLVSRVSSRMRDQSRIADVQRWRSVRLYELSRAILLIDSRRSTSEQLSALICELMNVDHVAFWVEQDVQDRANNEEPLSGRELAHRAYLAGDSDDRPTRTSCRLLRVGTTPIGAIVLSGWETDALLADAIASLAAVALERARAVAKENRAEAARAAEQLRTAVLDGLAHGFKTPLTAIQTASSGLLAIGHLTATQDELVSIIDEEATMLAHLTTRLLQTAALEAREVRLRRSPRFILLLLEKVLAGVDERTRERVQVMAQPDLQEIAVDAQLVELALLQLIDNAAKYATVDTPILITIAQAEAETSVTVSNEGPSIRSEDQKRIFERFYRGVSSSSGPTGTGLGLSIVKKTAEAHGGRAWVECADGTTHFLFTLAGPQRTSR